MIDASSRSDTPMERAVLATVPFLAIGLIASVPLLFVRWSSPPLTIVIVHLAALVLLGLVAVIRLAPMAGNDWFNGQSWPPFWRLTASGISAVFLATGMVGLVTLASSAALRYPPSLQFLQLLSALDIAWAGAALVIGVYRAWRLPAAVTAGIVLAIICVWSIWRYLDVVGFGPAGEWMVDSAALAKYVLPFDVAAAVMAIVAFVFGTHRQAMEQASPQS
ncbi:MAG: hypothetical protein U9R51_05110 [Actinomycetota bacterium]|nr:hypothetical protein [Actinomycetota bacterium]